jgi:hypothetical protein
MLHRDPFASMLGEDDEPYKPFGSAQAPTLGEKASPMCGDRDWLHMLNLAPRNAPRIKPECP